MAEDFVFDDSEQHLEQPFLLVHDFQADEQPEDADQLGNGESHRGGNQAEVPGHGQHHLCELSLQQGTDDPVRLHLPVLECLEFRDQTDDRRLPEDKERNSDCQMTLTQSDIHNIIKFIMILHKKKQSHQISSRLTTPTEKTQSSSNTNVQNTQIGKLYAQCPDQIRPRLGILPKIKIINSFQNIKKPSHLQSLDKQTSKFQPIKLSEYFEILNKGGTNQQNDVNKPK